MVYLFSLSISTPAVTTHNIAVNIFQQLAMHTNHKYEHMKNNNHFIHIGWILY